MLPMDVPAASSIILQIQSCTGSYLRRPSCLIRALQAECCDQPSFGTIILQVSHTTFCNLQVFIAVAWIASLDEQKDEAGD